MSQPRRRLRLLLQMARKDLIRRWTAFNVVGAGGVAHTAGDPRRAGPRLRVALPSGNGLRRRGGDPAQLRVAPVLDVEGPAARDVAIVRAQARAVQRAQRGDIAGRQPCADDDPDRRAAARPARRQRPRHRGVLAGELRGERAARVQSGDPGRRSARPPRHPPGGGCRSGRRRRSPRGAPTRRRSTPAITRRPNRAAPSSCWTANR